MRGAREMAGAARGLFRSMELRGVTPTLTPTSPASSPTPSTHGNNELLGLNLAKGCAKSALRVLGSYTVTSSSVANWAKR